ncbi:ATP-dependent RecD-like DNA helicase [Methylacidimicrobium cyclopophantes]|uniref:ATP-dependent RecD-like DNA helicase n=1 Tax=Methylacidimicrobium cyclopophantes TaxID=1041766 RepID=A0A5E6M7M6_9BACT|nr:ATP-dependent RecD-like DNA helicase [Methylacidimicrobium cyclopophantes]VVM04351.1 ATP-dependent RecD-like DNA helicase [Methylacidimicrobium cyclopophantes]
MASSLPPPEKLSGLVERVTFFSEESGFCVLKVKVAGRRQLVPVIGRVASVGPGEWLTAEGRWVREREHGLQFRADSLRTTPPTTLEGIEKYLGSGMVKGIGPVYAKKLVERFGEKILEIVEKESARLEEVDGIGPTRRKRIKDAWNEQKAVREIMLFLHSHGVSTSRALRIYKTYGPKAVETVRAQPYRLARDIPGIGFQTADQIARRVGIAQDSLDRACAGLAHLLLEAAESGHCALPVRLLLEGAEKLLELEEARLREAMERSAAQGDLLLEDEEGESWAFLPYLQRAEERIAERIASLLSRPPRYPPIDWERALEWARERTGKELSASQRTALRRARESRLLVVTGGPGVGKTTFLRTLLLILGAKGVRVLLCAPTGRAAKRLAEATGREAKTIHRLLEVQPATGRFTRDEDRPLECDLLVVDECSMVDVPLFGHLLRALPEEAGLLAVGDADQLPSVGPGMVLRDLVGSGVVPVAELTEVFRQAAGSRIIATAHRMRRGLLPERSEAEESDFYFVSREEPERIASTLLEMVKTRIPQRFGLDPLREIQVLSPMNRGSLGVIELNERLQAELNPLGHGEIEVERFGWCFRLRDKVIQTKNNYQKEVFNGDIGEVIRIDPEEQVVSVRFEGRELPYEFGELDELSPAYAITIHKSQGSEFPAVVIPLAMQHYLLLQRNLVYTALTRAKRLAVLVGQWRALAAAIKNDRIERRFSRLLPRLRRACGVPQRPLFLTE